MSEVQRIRLVSGFTESPLSHERETLYEHYVLASDYDALRLQLSRAKEWMQHEPRCNIHDHHFGGMPACTCGLTEFLKEVGGGG